MYCTGRSTRERPATPGRPETIEETAELVTAAGGRGIPIRVDHTQAEEIDALFDRVEREAGAIDVVVNDLWGGDAKVRFGAPFWEQDPSELLSILEPSVFGHFLTSRRAARTLISQRRGLIIEITDGDFQGYRLHFGYDLAKAAAIRMAYAMAIELQEHNVTALAVTPGFLRSESMLEHFGVTEANWRDGVKVDPHFIESETPCFVGRAVAALASDPKVHQKSGRVFGSWTLAREYGFTDIDGRKPDWGAYFDRVIAEIIARGGPRDDSEMFLLRARYYQIHGEHERRAQVEALRHALQGKVLKF